MGKGSRSLKASTLVALSLVATTAAAAASERFDPIATGFPGAWTPLAKLAARLAPSAGFSAVEPGSVASRFLIGFDVDKGPSLTGAEARLSGVDAEQTGGIRARVGYAFGSFVAYGAAGLAFTPAGAERGRGAMRGVSIGGGLEAMLFDGLSARAEYLYVDLDRRATDALDVAMPTSGGQFRAGLNYRF